MSDECNCKLCGEPFIRTRLWQIYCSNYCRLAAFKRRSDAESRAAQAETDALKQKVRELEERLARYETGTSK